MRIPKIKSKPIDTINKKQSARIIPRIYADPLAPVNFKKYLRSSYLSLISVLP